MILVVFVSELLPLLAVVVLAGLLAVPAALVWSLSGTVLSSRAASLAAILGAGSVVAVASEILARKARADREPEWVSSLDALGESKKANLRDVGGKALALGRLVRFGVPVPEGVVLTTALVDRIRASATDKKGLERAWAALPSDARRDLEAFLASVKGELVVRASFTDHGALYSYAGVFATLKGVAPTDRVALLAAVVELLGSADDAVGRAYRKRRGAPSGSARAVVLQRQIDAEVRGTVVSRGFGGTGDSVLVDFARRRSPIRSFDYDLVDGTATPIGTAEPLDTPAWMHRVAVLAVTLEAEWGSAVNVEFATEQGQPYVLDVRPVTVTERKTWLHVRPLDASGERVPTFALELRGGLPLVRQGLSAMLARAGSSPDVEEDEVRYADGLVYFDAEVLRRALARLGADVLVRGGLGATLRSVAAVRKRPLPKVPQVNEITPDAWPRLRAWHRDHLLGAAQTRFELVGREWLITTLLRLIDGAGSKVEDPRGHPALRWLLKRRVAEARVEAERQRTVLGDAETELASAVARVLARGAAAWNAMFQGDRHLFATFDEIDAFSSDTLSREALEAEWKTRRTTYEQRRHQPAVRRVHRPPLPEIVGDTAGASSLAPAGISGRPSSQKLYGVGVAPGIATGPAVILTGQARGVGVGAILIIADASTDLCSQLYEARGVVLLSGGVASSVVALARELGIPVVLCPAAHSLATVDITIDGAAGTVATLR